MAKSWAAKREPIRNQPRPGLSSVWNRHAAATFRLWLGLAVIGGVLGNVVFFSVRTGPSAGGGIAAIRTAQQALWREKPMLRESVVSEAESLLIRAWMRLKDRRYEESILAARAAYQKAMDSSR
jgi:hypothetical protein